MDRGIRRKETSMAWSKPRAEGRIEKYLESVPRTSVSVETFEKRYERMYRAAAVARATPGYNPLVKIPPSQAVLVHGVHVYVQLTEYHALVGDVSRDRDERHKRMLKFLHTHYSATDQVVIEYEAQRVDYHGPRLHAVIATPVGNDSELDRIRRAIDFAMAVKRMIEMVGAKVLGGEFATGVRIGIDSGMAVAVNSGRGDEQEPLFLGNPANYAAKLAEGDEPGIYLSDRVRAVLGMARAGSLAGERKAAYVQDAFGTPRFTRSMSDGRIEMLSEDLRKEIEPQLRDTEFHFHRHQPPLSTIDYSLLRPSNTIHMHMLSIFADIDGFTAYVQRCIDTGNVQELVSNLHVIRKELAAVLKADFSGRKIRFIGDCLHGILSEGDRLTTDAGATVESGVLCAGGMRSSFELCQRMLSGIGSLGLAIGMEYGTTPVTRLGSRGDMSVRCATSRAVTESENMQSKLAGNETGLGGRALSKAPFRIRKLFDNDGTATGLTYAAVATLAVPAVFTAAATPAAAQTFRPHTER
jgi:class 3 adenylate cyclase